jgi:hypothetical protein
LFDIYFLNKPIELTVTPDYMLTITLSPERPLKPQTLGSRARFPSLPFRANKMIKKGKKVTDSPLK